jgi:regulator of CtrA degradation
MAFVMPPVASLNPRIVEALYIEALVLSDAARARFDQLREDAGARVRAVNGAVDRLTADHPVSPDDVEVMCEALRTTTRVMHCLAWLLNHRAWFAGEISAMQLRRHGRLITHFPASDPQIVRRLPEDLSALVLESELLYARIQRLEAGWRNERPAPKGEMDRLRERLAANAVRQA